MDLPLLSYSLLVFVAVQRIAELFWARRNTKALLREGAYEVGARHYSLFIILHASWLAAIGYNVLQHPGSMNLLLAALYLLVQGARIWVLFTLGKYWTTRIIVVPDAPLVKTGLYRWLNHPNYLIVICEVALLPLVFGLNGIAIIFSCLNAVLLWYRTGIETAANRARFTPG